MKQASHTSVFMPHSEPSIKCSNPHCQAYNELKSRFCHKCKTPVVKRYLWTIEANKNSETTTNLGESEDRFSAKIPQQSQELVTSSTSNNRYLQISDRIFLDTKPGKAPQISHQLPEDIIAYLQLFTHFPYVPQVYGQIDEMDTWLLDYGTVPVDREGRLIFNDLLPAMTSLWSEASYLRQIKWLRQIAGLWKPLREKGTATTLLNPELIRVNGSLIQLRELTRDEQRNGKPILTDLGKIWQEWSHQSHPKIQDVLIELSERILNGSIERIEQIIQVLDSTLDLCSQSQEYSYEMFAMSDSGPTRSNNQDTAYPNSELPIEINPEEPCLTIVCDGVGGHEGGEIASQNTVDYLQENVSQIDWNREDYSPAKICQQLVKFTNEANDAISQRNDSEQRQERQRMGTTLVMSLARNHEIYLTHVGDSRIYLITDRSCHQMTVDDDLASREVRLGYAVYRDALRYPSAGSLIQALGMRNSEALHPNIERLLVDEDCLLLLCSDGLSDFDRVEQYWRDVIAPVLEGKLNLQKSVQTLIKIGNKRNGHDNITAALVHCRVKSKSYMATPQVTWSDVEMSLGDSFIWTDEALPDSTFLFAENISAAEDITDAWERLPEMLNNVRKKQKSPFLSIIVVLSITLVFSLGILIYANTNKNNESPQNSWQSKLYTA